MHHIEQFQCTTIFPSTLEARQRKNDEFAKALESLDSGDSPQIDLEGGFDLPAKTDTWLDDPTIDYLDGYDNMKPRQGTTIDQNYTRPEDFPRLSTQEYRAGGSKVPDFLTGDAPGSRSSHFDLLTGDTPLPEPLQPTIAWAEKKGLIPKSRGSSVASTAQATLPAPPPTFRSGPPLAQDKNSKIRVVQSPSTVPATTGSLGSTLKTTRLRKEVILDPLDPDFNAAAFYEPMLELFKCPHFRQCR